MKVDPNSYDKQRQRSTMESLVEGIREGVENATRADCLADRMECLMQTASMCKTLRTKCNRALMEIERTNSNKRKHLTP